MRTRPACLAALFAALTLIAAPRADAQAGLDARPSNPTCLAPASPSGVAAVAVQNAFPSAPTLLSPVKILQAPGDATRWFILERGGRVRMLGVANPGTLVTWLDLRDRVDDAGEGGLLGMAFPPDWPARREVYLSYTTSPPLRSVVSRMVLDDVAMPLAPVEEVLLTVDQPFTNHKGGDIDFGPDGRLYIGLGDGGSAGDPYDVAQDPTRLLGSMLRIDVLGVSAAERYRIPADNPFAANPRCGAAGNAAACPEAWAWGLRNPWRWSFDRATGALWAGDVGQGEREEIDVIERGGNYGWRCREGSLDHLPGSCAAGTALAGPAAEYDHAAGRAVIGGVVYRGSAIPALRGQYVFADFEGGWIGRLRDDGSGRLVAEQLASGWDVAAFATGADGELYFADYTWGRIRKLVAGSGTAVDTVPMDLAATGCLDPADPARPAPGLVPYGLNAPFWSDAATKERWLALPDGARITIGATGDWSLPPGSVLMKNFRIEGRLVETRLLMHHTDGAWGGYTYEWNDAQTAATRVLGGKVKAVGSRSWTFPGSHECRACHTAAAGFSLGLEHAQLNGDFTYPATGRRANQVTTFAAIGMFSAAPPAAAQLPRLADPGAATAPLHARARAYLHANCSQCHRAGGPATVGLDFQYATPLQGTGACGRVPQAGGLGLAGARVLAPGSAAASVLVHRAARRDAYGMPPVGSAVVDHAGVALLAAWANSLGSCSDTDGDMADDVRDNCPRLANTDQRDTDADGFGNRCDADLDGSGVVNAADVALFRMRFGSADPHADFNGDGAVNAADLAILRTLFGAPPGR